MPKLFTLVCGCDIQDNARDLHKSLLSAFERCEPLSIVIKYLRVTSTQFPITPTTIPVFDNIWPKYTFNLQPLAVSLSRNGCPRLQQLMIVVARVRPEESRNSVGGCPQTHAGGEYRQCHAAAEVVEAHDAIHKFRNAPERNLQRTPKYPPDLHLQRGMEELLAYRS